MARPRPNRLLTLTIAVVASAAAAIFTSKVWDGGVLGSAVVTPVIVTLLTELLSTLPREEKDPVDRGAPTPRRRLGLGGIVAAILIGLAAFVIAALALTIPEVAADQSITGASGQTTFFGSNADTPWGEARSWSDCFDDIEQCVRDIVEENQ